MRKHSLGFKEVLGGSLGGMGLSGGVIIAVPIILTKGGTFTPLIFLAAMFAFLLVATQINAFASRIVTQGSLCDYAKVVFGDKAGATVGWILLSGYVAFVPAYLATVPHTLITIFSNVGNGPEVDSLSLLALATATAVLASWLSIRNVTLSTRTLLTVEVLSLGLLALAIGEHARGPWELVAYIPPDPGAIQTQMVALALAMVCFTGFEGATVFGVEAKRPRITVPRANIVTVLVVGIVYTAASVLLIGSLDHLPLGDGSNPFAALIATSDLRWGLPVVLTAAALSWFGGLLACLNAGGRLLYTLAQHGHSWRLLGRIHPRFATPHIAVIVIISVGMTATIALVLAGVSAMDILVGAASMAAIAFLLAYAMVSVAAVVDRWRAGMGCRRIFDVVLGAITIMAMLLPIIWLAL